MQTDEPSIQLGTDAPAPPEETRVTLQSHITRQLEDEALANGVGDVIELERI
ncbi:MAG: hypothetical protein IJ188_10400 [Clostridia bacterium]|nr:hypothetical protein [Clostridia bacterium]